jgi:predicted DNA-binding transcriptional regulator YafY
LCKSLRENQLPARERAHTTARNSLLMSATHLNRIERLHLVHHLIARVRTAPARCPDVNHIESLLGDDYGHRSSPEARRRMLQRDLSELVSDGRIEVVNPGCKPLRYRCCKEVRDDNPAVLEFTRRQIAELVGDMVPARRLNALWRSILLHPHGPLLDEQQLRILPDTLRLVPADINPVVLNAVLTALSEHRTLKVLYQNNAGERSRPRLHPQALVQRGPVTYLLALKNSEREPVRFYALHRLIRARMEERDARAAVNFDLDQAIEQGRIDFGRGEKITLELRVRGYLDAVLRDCPLSDTQELQDEPEGSDFSLTVRAEVPSSGALLRWLLAGGDNLEVIAPTELRQVLSAQAAKMAALYAP